MKSSSGKKRKSQTTLFGGEAFDPYKHCEICKAILGKYTKPHRKHHPDCWNNSKTKGKLQSELKRIAEAKRLKDRLNEPLTDQFSGIHATQANVAAFMTPKPATTERMKANPSFVAMKKAKPVSTVTARAVLTAELYKTVTALIKEPAFFEKQLSNTAPLPMVAFAKVVVDQIILNKDVDMHNHMQGITFTVPEHREYTEPHYYSIVGQKLLYVDWTKVYGVTIPCPRKDKHVPCCPTGVLKNDRTHFSKNSIIFPIFVMEGPPQWCMVQSMKCEYCHG